MSGVKEEVRGTEPTQDAGLARGTASVPSLLLLTLTGDRPTVACKSPGLSINNMYQVRASCGPSRRPGAERLNERKQQKPAFKEGLTHDKRGRKQFHSLGGAVLAVCAIRVLRTGGEGGPGGFGEEAGLAESWRLRCGEQRSWGPGRAAVPATRCCWQSLLCTVPAD